MIVVLLLAPRAFGLGLANRPPPVPLLAVLEVPVIGFPFGGLAQKMASHLQFARAEFAIYLLACGPSRRRSPPGGWGERSRAVTAVLPAGFLIIPVMVIRVQQVWAGLLG
jgi:hypothetical protein